MLDYRKLSTDIKDDSLKPIFKIIADSQPAGVGDSGNTCPLSVDATIEIQELMLDKIRGGMALDGGYITLDEARKQTANGMGQMIADSFFNPANGIGTTADPGYYNDATIPVSMSPNEATAYYSNGGVSARIIDMKSQGILVNGYRFLCDKWNPADLEKLKEYADSVGFDKEFVPSVRDGLIYGGSLLVPALKRDNACTYGMSVDQLIKDKILVKNSIERFWSADRWNAVLIPDYNISAADYLTPRSIFVPITGKEVNTSRAALIRPKQLPYWGTIRQMGWGISDMEGWIRSLLGLEMCYASIPIMAQQSSVMYRHIPLDGIIAQNGPQFAESFAKEMSKQMVSMSNVAPKTFNLVGEIKTIERNFQGFGDIVHILEKAVGSKADVPDSVLFNTSATGFSKNTDDISMKQANTVQNIGNKLIPQLQPIVKMLVCSCFGPDSEQAKMADMVRIDFDTPVVLTNQQRNEAGTTFSAVLSAGITAGLQPADAIDIAHKFTPDIELPDGLMDRLRIEPDLMNEGSPVETLTNRLTGGPIGRLSSRISGKNDSPVSLLADRIQKKPNLFDRLVKSPISKLFGK